MKLPKLPKAILGTILLFAWGLILLIFSNELPQDASDLLKLYVLLGTIPPTYVLYKISDKYLAEDEEKYT